METSPTSQPLDLDAIRSRIKEMEEIHSNCNDDGVSEMATSESDQILKDCALQFESKVKEIISECSDLSFLGIEDLDAFLEHLKEELRKTEAENAKISDKIESLSRTHLEDSTKLEGDLEWLKSSVDFISSPDVVKSKKDSGIDGHSYSEDQLNLMNVHGDQEFEILRLENQIETSKIMMKSMQDLDFKFKRFEAIEQIEDALSGLKVIEFDGTCIRLSLRTYVPKLEDFLCQRKVEDTAELSEVNHELLIEVVPDKMELNTVEIFPNDIYIGDIIDAAKSYGQSSSQLGLIETRSPLEWFVRKVQDRIMLCTLRRFAVKSANKSRHSVEYLDRDEILVVHLVGGIDAFIKVSPGWPISIAPLTLVSLKASDHHSNEVSLSFLCKVEELVNALDLQVQQNLSHFIDAIEKVLMEQMRLQLHSESAPGI